jgi:hypothetical protein
MNFVVDKISGSLVTLVSEEAQIRGMRPLLMTG